MGVREHPAFPAGGWEMAGLPYVVVEEDGAWWALHKDGKVKGLSDNKDYLAFVRKGIWVEYSGNPFVGEGL